MIDIAREDEPGVVEQVIKRIALSDSGVILDTLPTADLSRVFFAGYNGVGIVDGFTMQQFDADPSTAEIDLIQIPGDKRINALAIDAEERYLYSPREPA